MQSSLERSRELGKKIRESLDILEKPKRIIEAEEEVEEIETEEVEIPEEPEPEPEVEEEPQPKKKMTKKELFSYAKELGLHIKSGLRKAEIEKIINEGIFED